jgi:hypothetical protein
MPIVYFTIDSDLRHRIIEFFPFSAGDWPVMRPVHQGQGSVPFGPFLEISHVRSDHAPWLGWPEGMAMAGWI